MGIVFNVKCYHPETDTGDLSKDSNWPTQCETIEGGDDPEYQGYRCPKCGHEICVSIKQYLFMPKDLGEK